MPAACLLASLPASLQDCQPACQPASLQACQPASLPAYLPACLPSSVLSKDKIRWFISDFLVWNEKYV
jgi:hypothetical protein